MVLSPRTLDLVGEIDYREASLAKQVIPSNAKKSCGPKRFSMPQASLSDILTYVEGWSIVILINRNSIR